MQDKYESSIQKSDLISRDLSWLHFNYRVLDQAKHEERNVLERLKFLAITASNADEFFMIRVGSLYNYIDYDKERIDYSGLRSHSFKKKLLHEYAKFHEEQNRYLQEHLIPAFEPFKFKISRIEELNKIDQDKVSEYFKKTIYPMLTPMVYDSYHSFPILMNKILIFGVVTKNLKMKEKKKMSFIQIPQNLPRFFEINRRDYLHFIPIEDIIAHHIDKLFLNVNILSVSLFRVTRNGDFTLEESEDIEANFLEEMKRKLKTRKTGRVVRLEVQDGYDKWLLKQLRNKWELDQENIMITKSPSLIDYTGLWQIVNHEEFKDHLPPKPKPVPPVSMVDYSEKNIFKILKDRDVLLHHPYNTIDPLLELLEKAAEDPYVLSIKLTIYRLAKNSRVTAALLEAAENGKHVSVLFEVKARFDEENNMREAQKLQKAGCFVIYGVGTLKTHTKLLLIVRKEAEKVTRYVHMGSGNYNESTSGLYTDLGFMTTDSVYANDVSEFFNVITGHSIPEGYTNLITAPRDMREKLIGFIRKEAENAKAGLPSGIVFKMNSLQDDIVIRELYKASQAGVVIKLIVRGICCLRPGRKGLSENITVRSIVGEYLEHSRVYYFHNNGEPKVYSGSADVMVRSFDRRLESLFSVNDWFLKNQIINLLVYNLKDNFNAYEMNEDGSFTPPSMDAKPTFNIHKEFYKVTREIVEKAKLFD